MNELKTTIGLEIHVQLKTKSKMFCRCDNDAEGKAPNTVVCPVCLGLPGALPVANEEAVRWTIKAGLALDGSKISKIAKFDRKHYFYPDLPKGYQISQYDEPFVLGGSLTVGGQKVRFNRIHLEEDAGKLIHAKGKSLVDLNRAGTPLMEMVTEPDITSPKLAGDFLRRLQKLVRDEVQVSDADLEKGHFRCDANISVCDDQGNMSEIVELKNLNSFRFIEKALQIEEERLREEYPNWPKKKAKVTRGYDSDRNVTFAQREKEEAADYRYFPEPDLPPVDTTKFDLEAMRQEIGESYDAKLERYNQLGLDRVAKVVIADKAYSKIIDEAIKAGASKSEIVAIGSMLVNKYLDWKEGDAQHLEKILKIVEYNINPEVGLLKEQVIELLSHIRETSFTIASIEQRIGEMAREREASSGDLSAIVDKILTDNPQEVENYRSGKKQLIGFFMGQVMKVTGGKVSPQMASKVLREKLEQ